MIRRYKEQIRDVTGVAAGGGTVRVQVPIGRRLLALYVSYYYSGGTNTVAGALALVSEIRFYIGSKVQRRYATWNSITGGQILYDDLLLNGITMQGVPNTAPGVTIPIYFAEPYRKDRDVQNSLGLPTQWKGGRFDEVRLEIDLAASTAPAVKVHAVFDDVIPTLMAGQSQPGLVKVYPYPANASGTKYVINPPDKQDLLTQMSIYPDSGGSNDLEIVTLRKNGEVLHEFSYAANKSHLLDNGMTPAASGRTSNIYDVIFDPDDVIEGAESLAEARSFSLELDAGAGTMSGTQLLMIQRIGQPD
jgi:hypothetical protein